MGSNRTPVQLSYLCRSCAGGMEIRRRQCAWGCQEEQGGRGIVAVCLGRYTRHRSEWSVMGPTVHLSLCVTTGHILTSAPPAPMRRPTATSQTAPLPTWCGAPSPAACQVSPDPSPLEDPAWGPQDQCPCRLHWSFGSATGQEASRPPFSRKCGDSPRIWLGRGVVN